MYSNHPRNPVELSSRISVFRLNLGRFQSRIRTYTWQGFLRVFGDIFSNFFYWFTARKLIGKFRKIFIAAFRIGYLTVLVEFFLAQFVRFNTSILWVAHANFANFRKNLLWCDENISCKFLPRTIFRCSFARSFWKVSYRSFWEMLSRLLTIIMDFFKVW